MVDRETLMGRPNRLSGPQADSLLAFAKDAKLLTSQIIILARMTGRGYRPPTTVDKWKQVWGVISKYYPGEEKR